MSMQLFFGTLASCVLALCGGAAFAQDYPSKPIRIVVPGAGGGGDVAARLLAPAIAAPLGQPVLIDNRPIGFIPADTVAKSAPDGHTLLFSGSGMWLQVFLRNDVPWDPVRDFAPVTLTVSTPNLVIVNGSLPVKTLKELIALAKARPGQLNYGGSGSEGSPNHLAAELFKSMAGVNIVRVPYKTNAQSVTDLLSGEVQVMFSTPGGVMQHVKSGRLRALAVTTAKPSALVPGVPTAATQGLPGYESISVYGVFAPAKTPAAAISRLNQEIVRALNRPDLKEKFLATGTEVVASSADELAAFVKYEMTRLGKVIKDLGIRGE
jgi:tripartite-type tricarboxylate transporter receptor subunit TctC